MVQVNCETDFVARNDGFRSLVSSVARSALHASQSQPGKWHLKFGSSVHGKLCIGKLCIGNRNGPKSLWTNGCELHLGSVATNVSKSFSANRTREQSFMESGGVVELWLAWLSISNPKPDTDCQTDACASQRVNEPIMLNLPGCGKAC